MRKGRNNKSEYKTNKKKDDVGLRHPGVLCS